MVKQPIKIKRWKIYIRRALDALRASFYRVFSWTAPAGRRNRRGLKINPLESGGTALKGTVGGGEVIRITVNPGTVLESGPAAEQIAPPPMPRVPTAPRVPKPEGLRGGNINVSDGVKLCAACGDPLKNEEHRARCQNDHNHMIHRKCLGLMKHKCPHCGGRLL
jgi:hypothetical protein